MKSRYRLSIVVLLILSLGLVASAQQRFSELLGPVAVQPVQASTPLPVPYITWGGDVATFLANGGLSTKPGSTYQQLGLNLRLTPGDDFIGQVKDYLGGKTPFLRGTMRMLGQASEVLGQDPRTKPVVIMQLSWSAGDHIVAREKLKTLNDLAPKEGRKVRIACQQGGPHVGLLYDALDAAKIPRMDIDVVWVKDLTGANGPADAFRKDSSIDACCVITPDMIGLTGGLESAGTGAEGTVRGAHVLVSTQQMSRSIADVYAVRSDWYQQNKPLVEKFVAGYLKATQQVVQMRRGYEESQKMSDEYKNLLALAQSVFGKEVLPTLEVDAHGLLLDCSFVGLPGQIAYFEDRGNLNGFEPKMKSALDLATTWGYAGIRAGFDPPALDYRKVAQLAAIEYVAPQIAGGFAERIDVFPGQELDERTIVSFTINFEPNQSEFSADRYGAEFHRAIQAASTFGNAVVVIRGHADPTKALIELIKAGMEKGLIRRTGRPGDYRYFLQGKPLDLEQTGQIVKLIESGTFETPTNRPKETVQAALNLSLSRAQAVRDSLVAYAQAQGVNLDPTQMQPAGAGIAEPLIPKPENIHQAKENMRVEFRVVRVPAEALRETDFDF